MNDWQHDPAIWESHCLCARQHVVSHRPQGTLERSMGILRIQREEADTQEGQPPTAEAVGISTTTRPRLQSREITR